MKKRKATKMLFRFMICLLTVAAVLTAFISCGKSEKEPATGKKTVTVKVIDDKGEETSYTAETEAQYLIDVLVELGLTEKSDDGFISTVNGITADYNKDGAYWALSSGGEMLMTGADSTVIADGDVFELTYTK